MSDCGAALCGYTGKVDFDLLWRSLSKIQKFIYASLPPDGRYVHHMDCFS